jgi:hypothetical protein
VLGTSSPSGTLAAMDSGPALTIIERRDGLIVGLWGNVFLTLWRGGATVELLQRVRAHHLEADRKLPGGFCALAVMSGPMLHMSPDARAEAESLSKNPGRNLTAIAQVITGTGFAAAATRALASGLMLVRKGNVPTKIFSEVAPAARWLTPYFAPAPGGVAPRPEDLALAVERALLQGP